MASIIVSVVASVGHFSMAMIPSPTDFSHRKAWIADRMKFLATIFAIDVCAFAILANHFHNILRNRPDIVAS